MKILVTGATGQLAHCLVEEARETVEIVALGRPQCDITEYSSVVAILASTRPDVVVNAAAYTAVDKAESEPDAAHLVNAFGAGNVARACAAAGTPLIHISTDYVFDGTGRGYYTEGDPTGPMGVYGRTKLAGEQAVMAHAPRSVVLRTAWVHSPFGNNFVKTMLRLAASRPEISVVADQHGSPTYAPHLARTVVAVAHRLHEGCASEATPSGIYHCAGDGEATWCELAREAFRVSSSRGGVSANVKAITTAEYPTPARRPANSRLDISRLRRDFGVDMPHWTVGVNECVIRLVTASDGAQAAR